MREVFDSTCRKCKETLSIRVLEADCPHYDISFWCLTHIPITAKNITIYQVNDALDCYNGDIFAIRVKGGKENPDTIGVSPNSRCDIIKPFGKAITQKVKGMIVKARNEQLRQDEEYGG